MVQKTQNKPQTPKQMAVKVESLMRGLDNSRTAIGKHQKDIEDKLVELKPLLAGLTSAATTKPPTPKAPAKPAKVATPAKATPKTPAKPAKTPAKAPAKPAKAPAKGSKAPAKPAKAAPVKDNRKPPVPNRPILKNAIKEMIAAEGGKAPAAKIYHLACDKYGYWSRQGFYAALHDVKSFHHTADDQFELVQTADEVEKFVDQASQNQATALVA